MAIRFLCWDIGKEKRRRSRDWDRDRDRERQLSTKPNSRRQNEGIIIYNWATIFVFDICIPVCLLEIEIIHLNHTSSWKIFHEILLSILSAFSCHLLQSFCHFMNQFFSSSSSVWLLYPLLLSSFYPSSGNSLWHFAA